MKEVAGKSSEHARGLAEELRAQNELAAQGLFVSEKDREILRALAKRLAELAALPVQDEKRALWYAHNDLKTDAPLIFCDPENGWHEIITDGDLECEGPLARGWEFRLRKEVFWGAEMGDDRVARALFEVPHVYNDTGWGLEYTKIGGEDGGSYVWESPVEDYARDLPKLHHPRIVIDEAATAQRLNFARDLFGDILEVRLKTAWWWTLGMTWTLVNLRGLEQIMFDMIDDPDHLHEIMAFLRDGNLARIDFLEENGLLYLNNDGSYVGSGGFGWTHELPQDDFDSPENGGKVRTIDMWGFAESQETVGVSPEMFEEFIFPYQLPLLERFGLNCYGCCEPLDKRWHVVERFPRLRRISVSPWADVAFMAERLGPNYVYSRKPNPAYIARPVIDEGVIREELRETLEAAKRHDCRLELIMKDNHTIGKNPRNPVRWVEIAREEIANVYG
jgi:hypothetical protein